MEDVDDLSEGDDESWEDEDESSEDWDEGKLPRAPWRFHETRREVW